VEEFMPALGKKNSKRIYLHRWIMNPENKQEVDHVNGNTLDNRVNNLRVCSRQQNMCNSKHRSHSGNNYKGVKKS
jgi:hypothetical protein